MVLITNVWAVLKGCIGFVVTRDRQTYWAEWFVCLYNIVCDGLYAEIVLLTYFQRPGEQYLGVLVHISALTSTP